MRLFPLLVLLALTACGNHNIALQDCRDPKTGWTGRTGRTVRGNGYWVALKDAQGWERDYRWEQVECRDVKGVK